MNSNQKNKHPKNCPCGCQQVVSWLDWFLLLLLLLVGWLLVKAVAPISHNEALQDVPACTADACFGMVGSLDGAEQGGRYVQRA